MSEQVPVHAIREALEAATPGPWAVPSWHEKAVLPKLWADDLYEIDERGPFMHATTTEAADAELIVLLRNNAEALLDALEIEQTAQNRASERVLALRADCDLHREGFEHDQADIKTLLQALWDAYAALGFDTDGDATPVARVAGMGVQGFARSVVSAAAEHRRDSEAGYDRDLGDAERRGAVKALRSFRDRFNSFDQDADNAIVMAIADEDADAIENGADL